MSSLRPQPPAPNVETSAVPAAAIEHRPYGPPTSLLRSILVFRFDFSGCSPAAGPHAAFLFTGLRPAPLTAPRENYTDFRSAGKGMPPIFFSARGGLWPVASLVVMQQFGRYRESSGHRAAIANRLFLTRSCQSVSAWCLSPRSKSLRIEAICALAFWWSMIFSENRLSLFRIML